MQHSTILVRADADATMGIGHVMRCLALMQAWKTHGGRAVFVSQPMDPRLETRIRQTRCEMVALASHEECPEHLEETLQACLDFQPSWVIADGYQFTPAFHKAIRQSGQRLLVIDDYGHLVEYHADILVNPNITAHSISYPMNSGAKVLSGTKYVFLRPEFLRYLSWTRNVPDRVNRILITLGGSDPENVTAKVVEAVRMMDDPELEIKVVAGAANRHVLSLQALLGSLRSNAELIHDASSMPELMAWADLAVTAAGCTCWEMALMGLPFVSVVLADNQKEIAAALQERGLSVDMGWHTSFGIDALCRVLTGLRANRPQRESMHRKGKEVVDGYGTERVIMHLSGEQVWFRPAIEADSRQLWEWANDPDVRSVSFNATPIPWKNHQVWLQGKLADSSCLLLIAFDSEEVAIGQVRFDMNEDGATISISIAQSSRGKGLGPAMLRQACQLFWMQHPSLSIQAYIMPGNTASLKAFVKAGFLENGQVLIYNQQAIKMVLEC